MPRNRQPLEIILKKAIEESTKEHFDDEEITAYLMMALEELCCKDAINRWIKYRTLSFACTAIGLNEKNNKRKSLFLKKAAMLRSKMQAIKIK